MVLGQVFIAHLRQLIDVNKLMFLGNLFPRTSFLGELGEKVNERHFGIRETGWRYVFGTFQSPQSPACKIMPGTERVIPCAVTL